MLTALLVASLVAVSSIGPGLLLVRRLRWSPVETLCGAVGSSLLALYLAGFALFAAGAPGSSARWITLACLVATLAAVPDLVALAKLAEVRRMALHLGLLLAWTLLLLSTVRVYTGGGWYGDWLEHYERSLFFADRGDPRTTFLDGAYELAARPPFMNVVAGHFLAQAGRSFSAYQLVAAFLGVLVYLPAALVARASGGRRREAPVVLAALLALNPFFVQNATWPWTKLLSAFYVLLGIALYLRGWRRKDASRMLGCALALASATLVHYSAAPFALAVGGHYLAAIARQRGRRVLAELPAMAIGGALVLSTWIVWSVAVLGVRSTFASNTAVTDAAPFGLVGNVQKVGVNLLATLVPHPLLRTPGEWIGPGGGLGQVNDYFFLLYQCNLLAAIGLVGGVAAAFVFWRAGRGRHRMSGAPPAARSIAERRFWIWLLASSGLVGVASVGSVDRFGLAHVVLQPVVLLGLVAIAVSWPTLSSPWRLALAGGAAVDFGAGILLHFVAQSSDPSSWAVAGVPRRALRPLVAAIAGETAFANGVAKLRHGLVFVGDHFEGWLAPLTLAVVCGGCLAVASLWRRASPRSLSGEAGRVTPN